MLLVAEDDLRHCAGQGWDLLVELPECLLAPTVCHCPIYDIAYKTVLNTLTRSTF